MSKEEQFEKLWLSKNPAKSLYFRNLLSQKVRQKGLKPTKENCKRYWLGEL